MGREVRRVPPDWEHPRDARGAYVPLHSGPFRQALADWENPPKGYTGDEWCGGKPRTEEHMPEFLDGTATHWQMYEDCSEGTPISPVLASPEELARWLAENGASAFGDMTASYEGWLATIRRGWAPSAVFTVPGGLLPGVEVAKKLEE